MKWIRAELELQKSKMYVLSTIDFLSFLFYIILSRFGFIFWSLVNTEDRENANAETRALCVFEPSFISTLRWQSFVVIYLREFRTSYFRMI
jgi:hypothetical protein